MSIGEFAGIGALFLSLANFFIRLYDRKRKSLDINIYDCCVSKLSEDYDVCPDCRAVAIQFINKGKTNIILYKYSFRIYCNKESFYFFDEMIWDGDPFKLLEPYKTFTVGVTFDQISMDERHKGVYDISASIKDLDEKLYKSKLDFKVLFEVDAISLQK